MFFLSFEKRTSRTRSSSGNGTEIDVSLRKGTILKGMLPKLKSSKCVLVYRSGLGAFWYTLVYGWGNGELVSFQGMYMWYIKFLQFPSSYRHVVCLLTPPSISTLCPAVGVLVNCWFKVRHKTAEWGSCSFKTGNVKRRCEGWTELIGLSSIKFQHCAWWCRLLWRRGCLELQAIC
jgi:hypothetical protein